jgi:hypothetical protein
MGKTGTRGILAGTGPDNVDLRMLGQRSLGGRGCRVEPVPQRRRTGADQEQYENLQSPTVVHRPQPPYPHRHAFTKSSFNDHALIML